MKSKTRRNRRRNLQHGSLERALDTHDDLMSNNSNSTDSIDSLDSISNSFSNSNERALLDSDNDDSISNITILLILLTLLIPSRIRSATASNERALLDNDDDSISNSSSTDYVDSVDSVSDSISEQQFCKEVEWREGD